MTEHICSGCHNVFHQPFVCTTCGAEKLYDATVNALRAECEEQARLLGMSGEREAGLLARIEQLNKDIDAAWITNRATDKGRIEHMKRMDAAEVALKVLQQQHDELLRKIDALEPVAIVIQGKFCRLPRFIANGKDFPQAGAKLYSLEGIKK